MVSSSPARRNVAAASARAVLRTGCAPLHAAAERRFGLGACDTREDYLAFLLAMRRLTIAVRHGVRGHLAAERVQGLTADGERLDLDLVDLGVQSSGDDGAAIRLGDANEAFGALYVAEGSRLGGKVLARRASATLGLTADRGARFLNADGPLAGARWRRFLASLEAALEGPEERRAALAGARRTFTLLLATEAPTAPGARHGR